MVPEGGCKERTTPRRFARALCPIPLQMDAHQPGAASLRVVDGTAPPALWRGAAVSAGVNAGVTKAVQAARCREFGVQVARAVARKPFSRLHFALSAGGVQPLGEVELRRRGVGRCRAPTRPPLPGPLPRTRGRGRIRSRSGGWNANPSPGPPGEGFAFPPDADRVTAPRPAGQGQRAARPPRGSHPPRRSPRRRGGTPRRRRRAPSGAAARTPPPASPPGGPRGSAGC